MKHAHNFTIPHHPWNYASGVIECGTCEGKGSYWNGRGLGGNDPDSWDIECPNLVSVYTVQQGKKPTWEPGCAPNRPGLMIGKLVTSMRCAAFEPVEPFDAMKPGADRVNGNAG